MEHHQKPNQLTVANRLFYKPGLLLRTLTVLLLLLGCSKAIMAADESYIQTLSGKIKKGDSCTVTDDKFEQLSLADWNLVNNLRVDNIVSFELRQDTTIQYYKKAFSCTLNVTIRYFSGRDQLTPGEIKDVQLVVKYDTASGAYYPVDASYRFKNAYKVIVVVNSITSKEWGTKIPDIFRIRNQIFVQRQYPVSEIKGGMQLRVSSQPASQGGSSGAALFRVAPALDPVDQQLDINWNPADFPGAQEYDLEWTYIDKLGEYGEAIYSMYGGTAGSYTIPVSELEKWMLNNSTRVTVASPAYTINLAYTEGYILVRLRRVQYQLPANLRLTSDWVYVDNAGKTACVYIGHHNDKINWQYTGSFAEQGKRKEIVSYFDGALRSRQMVTISNSDEKAIVAETVYDIMGRAAMNILPAPVNDKKLKFYPAVNKNASGAGYSHNDISLPGQPNGSTCNITAAALNTTTGAAQYYSANNPFLNNPSYYFTKYVPNAGGYPFTVTEYTQDNTGRIRRQGGVGQMFQPGSGRETRYYYGKPAQKDLDRLFGVEAGNASHYLKNMVVDANGQVSVSYIDPDGKTIATALAGIPPGNVEELPSSAAATAKTRFNQALIRPADFRADAGALYMQSSATFSAVVPGNTTVYYSVNPAWLLTTTSAAVSFCNNCYYTVTVDVKDDCGNLVATKNSTPFTGNNINCNSSTAPVTGNIVFTASKIGEYTITYTLKLDEDQVKYQVDQYVTNNTDLKTLQMFLHDEVLALNIDNCYSECSNCEAKLGDRASFTSRMNELLLQLKNDKYQGLVFDPAAAVITTWISNTYTRLYNNCMALQAGCQPSSPCDSKLEMMKADVRPGGQYARYDPASFAVPAAESNVSIVSYNRGVALNYKSDPQVTNFEFTDENGKLRRIKDANVTVAEFFKAYLQHPEWADDFVKRHIEYCSYLWCRDYAAASYLFDAKLREMVNTGEKAVAAGYFSRGNYKAMLDNNKDPFFATGAPGATYKASMQNDLLLASDVLKITLKNQDGVAQAGKNILQLADWLLYCKPASEYATSAQFISSWNSCTVNSACRSLFAEWELYRNYYLQLKAKYVQMAKEAALPNCKNCFIGADIFSKGDCVDPGPLSDYSVTGNTTSRSVTYKNGTLPFKDNYQVVVKDNNGNLATVSAKKGQMSVSLPATNSAVLWNQVISVYCTSSVGVNDCPDVTGGVGPCPGISDFRLVSELQYEYESTSGNSMEEHVHHINDIYLEYIPGTLNRSVTVDVAMSDIFMDASGSNGCYKLNTRVPSPSGVAVTMQAGSSRVHLDEDVIRYGLYSLNGCYIYYYDRINYYLKEDALVSCSQPSNPLSQCATDPNFVYYQNKTRRFDEYVNDRGYTECMTKSPVPTATASNEAMRKAAIANLDALKQNWIQRLQKVLEQERQIDLANNTPQRFATITEAKIQTLAGYLYEIAKKNIETATIKNIMPTSSLQNEEQHGQRVVSVNGFNNFLEAFNAVVGASLVAKGFGPDLLDEPYPYEMTPYRVNPVVSRVDALSCGDISLVRDFSNTGNDIAAFHNYCKANYKDDYVLTLEELQDVLGKCQSGCNVLNKPVVMPIAFLATDVGPAHFTHCGSVKYWLTLFNTLYAEVSPNTGLYRVLFTNYLNHTFGFSLTFDEYNDFLNSSDCVTNDFARLFNKPASPHMVPDDFACTASAVRGAFDRAGQAYQQYIEEIKRNFRNAYVSRCLSNTASANIESDQFEYHYTLYYYDQAGNLVKTIPPEGVSLLNGADLDMVATYRNNISCLDNNKGSLQINNAAASSALYQYIPNVSNTFTIEFWAKPAQTITIPAQSTTGNAGVTGAKYAVFPAYVAGTAAAGAGISVGTNGVAVFEHSDNYMPALLSWAGTLNGWTHIAVVYTGKTPSLYINGSLVKTGLTSPRTTIYPSYSFTGNLYGAMAGNIDEVRIWSTARTAQQVSAGMNQSVLPASSNLAGYWPMNTTDGATAKDITANARHSQLVNTNWAWSNTVSPATGQAIALNTCFKVPAHTLPATYFYNSLNQVVKQSSPDGGTSEFWYDRLGRLVISQNEEQKTPVLVNAQNPANRFSYTVYDALGRIAETGEKLGAAAVTETNARTAGWLSVWMASGTNRQSTLTFYDREDPAWTWLPAALKNNLSNLRKRVVASVLLSSGSNPAVNRLAASYYSYDISGNVKTLTQENAALTAKEAAFITGSNGLKQIKYEYDLVSGKVNKVLYQDGKWDQFYYQYIYDADNRVISALSSRTNEAHLNLWVKEATYRYYLHGPLARVELGKNLVQGMDYAYTLQGWLKGVNGQFLNADKEMSGDGKTGSGFASHARDALAFTLGYFTNDYTPIAGHSAAPAFAAQYTAPNFNASGTPRTYDAGKVMYNGNISFATYAMLQVEAGATFGKTYRYDQLNRLTLANHHTAIAVNATTWGNSSISPHFRETFVYDANGNIRQLTRTGNLISGQANSNMDGLTYQYDKDASQRIISNRLRYVAEDPGNAAAKYSVDIDNQPAGNYAYDRIGNLVGDMAESITRINWTVYGKIASIEKNGATAISYGYDAAGNRVTKTLSDRQDFYVRDAQGNVLALYTGSSSSFTWAEQHLYGSSRLGIAKPALAIQHTAPLANANYNAGSDPINNGITGKRLYELSNHLGNVMVTISDRKTGVDPGNDGTIDYYTAEVLTAQDYYAFGMQMPGRKFNAGNYRYGFNGFEKDDEIKGAGNHISFGDYGYDPRIGRRWNLDPDDQADIAGYVVFNNNPNFFVDPDGESPISIFAKMVAKAGLKKAAKEFVEAQVKKQLARYSKDKWAKSLADDAFSFIDKATATAWWEYVVEVIPIAGDAYSAGKLGKQGYAVWKGLDRIKARVDAVVNTINKTDKLRSALKITDKALEAHHIIPTQLLKENKVVQDAVAAGFKFNDEVNGIAVKAVKEGGEHASHPAYNKGLAAKINAWADKNKDYTPAQAKEFIEGLANGLKKDIKDLTDKGVKVNEIIIK